MSFETLTYAVQDAVAEIRLNRPHRMNALTLESYDALERCLERAEADPAVRVVLLGGEGRAFCAGADLKEEMDANRLIACEQSLARKLHALPKPVIAAVHGPALGAGAEIILACDFILMARDASFALPEIGLGNFLGGGASALLPRWVGLAKAREIVMLGLKIDAVEAHAIGLACRIFSNEGFSEAARAFALEVASQPPLPLRLAKEQFNRIWFQNFEETLEAEAQAMRECLDSPDWQEKLADFRKRRQPPP
ncbi:MAG: enoyl-CoA hydratase/isomerase family protein [Alphaproteobacteria bacterium]|nr:enoyl-CoA hydratase/isomerase family protein [Alphaproteobacteria bacterium]